MGDPHRVQYLDLGRSVDFVGQALDFFHGKEGVTGHGSTLPYAKLLDLLGVAE